MSNMNNPAFKKLYNEILEKKLKDYAVTLEAELNNMPNIVKGLDIGNTVASAEASMIPSGGILESVHRGNNLLDRLSGLGTAVKKGVKGLGVASALVGALGTGFFAGTVGVVAKHSANLHQSNQTILNNSPLISGINYNLATKLNLGVGGNIKIQTGEEATKKLVDNVPAAFSKEDKSIYVKNAARSDLMLRNIARASSEDWPVTNLQGFSGDYSQVSAENQLRSVFDSSGFTALSLEKNKTNEISTIDLFENFALRLAHKKGYKEDTWVYSQENALTDDMLDKIQPVYDTITKDSNIVRLSKNLPQDYNKLTRSYYEILSDNLLKGRENTVQLDQTKFQTNYNLTDAKFNNFLEKSVYPRLERINTLSFDKLNSLLRDKEFIQESAELHVKNIPGLIIRADFYQQQGSREARSKIMDTYQKTRTVDKTKPFGGVVNYMAKGPYADAFSAPLQGWNTISSHSRATGMFKGALPSEIEQGMTTEKVAGKVATMSGIISDIVSSVGYNPDLPLFIRGCNYGSGTGGQEIADTLNTPVAAFTGYSLFYPGSNKVSKDITGSIGTFKDRDSKIPAGIVVFYPKNSDPKKFKLPFDSIDSDAEKIKIENLISNFQGNLKNE